MSYYVLDGRVPRQVNNILEWSNYFEKADRKVKFTVISDEVHVSTVFLGLDHSFGEGDPVLFETMIFGGKYNENQYRYHTWEEAEEGHDKAVAMCNEEDNIVLSGSGLTFK